VEAGILSQQLGLDSRPGKKKPQKKIKTTFCALKNNDCKSQGVLKKSKLGGLIVGREGLAFFPAQKMPSYLIQVIFLL